MPIDISQVVNYSVAGLAVFLMYRLAANHLEHNTTVLGELRDAIIKLTEFLERHHDKA